MSREEIQKLLGGYATDTLSDAERRALFEAALEDQGLFDSLAKEQALRDVLQEPLARQQLLDALGPPPESSRIRVWQWLRQPAALAVAMLLVMAGLLLYRSRTIAPPEPMVAQVRPPSPKPFAPPAPLQLKLQTPLPRPPMVKPEYHVEKPLFPAENPLLPAAAPISPSSGASIARLAVSAPQAVDLARQLYSDGASPARGFVAGALPQVRAKTPHVGDAAMAAANLGVRYSLLRKDADGEYRPASLDTEFHVGDSVRLRLEPNESGYFYLFQRDSTRGWRLASTQRVARGLAYVLPAAGALQYDQPGAKELLVVLSPQQQPSLENLQSSELDALGASSSTGVLKAIVPGGQSAYAVELRPQPGQQRVAFQITLQFR